MAYTTAEALVEEFWDCRLPVNPEFFAERLGLKVRYSNEMGLQSGYLDIDKREICINAKESPECQRFAIAHELGHFCLYYESSDRDTTKPCWFLELDPQKEKWLISSLLSY